MADEEDADALLAAVARRDRAAFRALYSGTSGKLFAVALRILRDRGRAEDALQETYVEVWRQAGNFDPARGSAGAWLAVIARNRAIDLLRREGRAPAARDDVDVDSLAPLGNPGRGSSAELMTLIACLDRLDREPRLMVLLAYLEGRTRDELAARFERPVNTVKTLLRRGLESLRACLDG